MKRVPALNLTVRIGLFILILGLGTAAALAAGETGGLALADLSGASVQTLAIAAPGHAFYAGVMAGPQTTGIYRSYDRGRTWQMIGPGPEVTITALAAHPVNDNVLFVGAAGGPFTANHNLWRSDDGGRSWRKFFLNLPAQPDGVIPAVTALVVDPKRPGALYVGTDGQGVYRFDVGLDGHGYSRVGDVLLAEAHIKKLLIGPDSRVYALSNDGLFTTTGDAWRKLAALPELAVSLAVAPNQPQTLYAGGASGGVYRSADGGQDWEPLSAGLDLLPGAALRITGLAVAEDDSQHVVAATAYGLGSQLAGGGLYESRDAGRHWRKLAELDEIVTSLNLEGGVIYAATPGGLVRYGQPNQPLAGEAWPGLHPLANPTVNQALILILTVSLAGLALVGRKEWLQGRGGGSL